MLRIRTSACSRPTARATARPGFRSQSRRRCGRRRDRARAATCRSRPTRPRMIDRDIVGPGHDAGRHAGFHRGGPRPHRIGAGIDHDFGFQTEDAAGLVGIGRQFIAVFTRMRRSDQMFAPVLDPAQRPIELHRQCGDREFFGVKLFFGPNPPPTSGATTRNLAFGDSEAFRQDGADDMGKLGRTVDDQFVEPPVVMRKHAAAFHRNAGMPPHLQALTHLHIGAGRALRRDRRS